MNVKNPFLQAVILVGAALAVAVIANGFAPRQRRLVLPGHYPNALKVPESTPEPAPIASSPMVIETTATTSVEPAPAETATIPTPATATRAATTTAPTPATAEAAVATQKPASQPAPAPVAPAKPAADALAHFKAHPDKPFIEIGGDDVAVLHRGGALFLDARRTSVFEEGHIAGARSFPVWEADIDDRVNALFAERSDPEAQNEPIVIYCSGGACEDSHMLAEKLWGIQFNNVYVYKDGFPDWQKRGGAVRTGGQP
jgi:rhodanese-related sulfurtransferase